MSFQIFLTLNSAILQTANFFALKHRPLFLLVFIEEIKNENRMYKIYEGIPNIAMIDVVNRQVKEIKSTHMLFIDFVQ